jgi:hypothetical protein
MEALFHRVRSILSAARGKDSAVPLAVLADQCCVSRREIEQVIEQRLEEFPFLLVAGAGGYFRPQTADDLNQYLHNLHSRHRRMQIREQTVRRKAISAGWIDAAGRFISPPQNPQMELFA